MTMLADGSIALQNVDCHESGVSAAPVDVTPSKPDYLVAYAKLIDDKQEGVYMAGIYFGGVGKSINEAEALARDVVNSVKGGTILPRIVGLQGGTIMDAFATAKIQLCKIEKEILEAEEIATRNSTLKKR